VIDKYILFSPLSTSTFSALITSKASQLARTQLFTQVIEGIAHLHENGIAHRDIKPQNLTVISYDPPLARIVDFGCATFEELIFYDKPGTIPYLAPEQKDGRYHGRSVDYWSCGLVGIEVLGFKRPYERVTTTVLKEMHQWLSDSDHPIAICCRGMLKEAPAGRMTAHSALCGPLQEYRQNSTKSGKRALELLPTEEKRSDGNKVPEWFRSSSSCKKL
jgi:serine/threonine protein kinase